MVMVINTQWSVGPLIMIFYSCDLCYVNPLQICKVIIKFSLIIQLHCRLQSLYSIIKIGERFIFQQKLFSTCLKIKFPIFYKKLYFFNQGKTVPNVCQKITYLYKLLLICRDMGCYWTHQRGIRDGDVSSGYQLIEMTTLSTVEE